MTDLGAFLIAQGGKRRKAGVHDCCTFPAEWAIDNDWPDPMADWRGAYDTEEDAEILIERAGGLADLFAAGMATAGIPRADGDPEAGDIGVLRCGDHHAGAIFAGKRWALVANRGLAIASVEPEMVVAIWRVRRG